MRRGIERFLLCVCVLLFLVSGAMAQKFTATIRGTVADQTGALVAGATVTVVEQNTGLTRTMKTGRAGEFEFPGLPIGTYRIEAKHSGFKTSVQKDLALHVDDIAVLNVKLDVGQASESVTVEASPLTVETQTGAVAGIVQGEQVRELPLNGRSFMQLTQLVPGVSAYSAFNSTDKGLLGGADMSISGGRTTGNQWLVDGANNNDVGSNRTILIYPSIDTIEEFKLNRNAYGPEFGGAAGGVVNIVTRGGSNAWHGSAYYFGRNDKLNATEFFLKRTTPVTPKQELRRNDFGGTIGGPLKKDKLFVFFSEEANREIRGIPHTALVPTAAELAGDFTGNQYGYLSNGRNITRDGYLAVPNTGAPLTTFAAAGVTPNPVALLYMKMFPTANVLPTAGTPAPNPNWVGSLNTPIYWREESIRGDWNVSSRNRLMVRYTQDIWDNQRFNATQSWADNQMGIIDSQWKQPSKMLVAKFTTTLGATAVNDFQVSWSHSAINVIDGGSNPALKQQITAAIPSFFSTSQKTSGTDLGAPVFWGGAIGSYGAGRALSNMAPWSNNLSMISFKDDFAKVVGKHSLKFGFLYSTNYKNEWSDSTQGESVQFWGTVGALWDPKNPSQGPGWTNLQNWVANMLWPSMIWGVDEPNHTNYGKIRWHDLEFYAGDNWRVTPRLTLEYGVRWSLLREPYEEDNKWSSFDPGIFVKGDASPCNGMWFAPGSSFCKNAGITGSLGSTFSNRALKENSNHAIAPRIGLAWDPTGSGKNAIRAGVGQFFQRERVGYILNMMNNPPFVTWSSGGRLLSTPAQLYDGQYSSIGAACGGAPNTWCGRQTLGLDPRAVLPNNWQYNLTVERELWKDSKLEVSYVGSRGVHLQNGIDLNPIDPTKRYQSVIASYQDWSGAAQAWFRPYSTVNFNSSALPNQVGPSAYTCTNAICNHSIDWFGRGGNSTYHSLQTMFQGRVGKTLMWQAAYTWSKLISDDPLSDSGSPTWSGGVLNDAANPGYDRGLSDLDRRHIFAFNFVYHLPKLADRGAFLKHGIGNWEIGSITNASSGPATTVYDFQPWSGTGNTNNARPNRDFSQPCYVDTGDPAQIINPKAFTDVGRVLGTLGNSSRGACPGPKTVNTDLAFYKNFGNVFRGSRMFKEGVNVQFRFEFFNLFNHTNFRNLNNQFSLANVKYYNGTSTPTTELRTCAGWPVVCDPTKDAKYVSSADVASGFGKATSTLNPREIQYSLKFTF